MILARLRPRLGLLLPVAVFLVCLAAYLPTLDPAFRADDSPETITASMTLGIQHPPGYPLHTLLGRLAGLLPLGAPAWRLNFFAALCAALGCALLAALTQGLALAWLERQRADADAADWSAALAGALAGIVLGYSHTFWSQALAAKGGIYTLHVAFMAAALLALFHWSRQAPSASSGQAPSASSGQAPSASELALGPAAWLRLPSARLSVFLLALGVGNHWETQALLLPAVAVLGFLVLWPQRRVLPLVAKGAKAPALPAEDWLGTLVPLAWLTALGLSVYLYLPLRSRLNPFLNWGAPRDWQQFWWVILRQEYLDLETGFLKSLRGALLAGGSWAEVSTNWVVVQRQGSRVLAHVLGLGADLGFGVVLLHLGGWAALRPQWRPSKADAAARWGTVLAVLALAFLFVVTFYFHLKEEMVWILDVFLLPVYLVQAALAGLGLLWLWQVLRLPQRAGLLAAACAATLTLLPWGLYQQRAAGLSQARQFLAYDYGQDLLLSVKPHGILLAEGDFNTMPIYYLQQVEGRRPDVDHVTTVFLSTDWGVEQARARQPRLGIGVVPKAITGARAGDGQVLRAALSQMAAANLPARPLQASLFRQVLSANVQEWEPLWRPYGLAAELNGAKGPEADRKRLNLLKAFRSRHLELDRATLDDSPAFALSNYGSAILDLAIWLRQEGNARAALSLYPMAVAWTSRANLAEARTHWGIALASGGNGMAPDLLGAASQFKLALQVKPLFEAWANLAGVSNQLGQATKKASWFVEAEAAARQALALSPNNPQAWNNLAISMYYQGRAAEAVQTLRTAAGLAPQDPQIQANLRALGGAH